ncbi:hypothetical protein COCOBI_19-1150 [Coccomyxa sp. Obi]|nr:hypothetical protein COCOBI_19-1150 [Coccomyxa sp. Obi]
MSEQEGLGPAVHLLVKAYEAGDVGRDVVQTLRQLLPFSHYCSVAICGSDEWLAASSNLLCPGSITMSLWPKEESLAGLAVMLSRQLRSYKQFADQRLFDVEQYHALHGPGALIATPLLACEGPPMRNAAGGYTSTTFGALLADLDVLPGTSEDLRMREHLRRLAGMLAPLLEAPGRAAADRLTTVWSPAAALGAKVPPPKQPAAAARRCRRITWEDPSQWPDDDVSAVPGNVPAEAQNPFSDGASEPFDGPPPGTGGTDSQAAQASAARRITDRSPISSSLLPSQPPAPKDRTTNPVQQDESSAGGCQNSGAQLLQEDRVGVGRERNMGAESQSLTSEDSARAWNGPLWRGGPPLSSRQWPAGGDAISRQLESWRSGPGADSSRMDPAMTSALSFNSDDLAAEKQAARHKLLASALQEHSLWLTFPSADLERSFAAWHGLQLQKLDRMALSLAAIIFACLGFMPPHSFAMHTPVAFAATAAIILFLLIMSWIKHPWYLARRTLLLKVFSLLYIIFNTQAVFPGVLDAMQGADGPCSVPFVLRYINAQPLLTSCVITMARFSIEAPSLAFQLALSLRLPSKVCQVCRSPAACLVNLHTQQIIVGLITPLAIVYLAERRFRANFLNHQLKKKR